MKSKNVEQRGQVWEPRTTYRACAIAVCLGLAILAANPSRAQIVGVPFIATAVGGGSTTTVGAYCSGSTAPTALDTFGDGCPAAQAALTASELQDLWTDNYGNIYIVDFTNSHLVRVIYHGGAPLATLITANNPTLYGSPQVGYIYAIAGSTGITTYASTTTPYCNGSSGTKAVDEMFDGCPAYEAWTEPTGGATDAAGDVFLVDHTTSAEIRVIYAGGAAAATLIGLEAGVTSPVIGTIYRIGDTSTGSSGFDGNGGLASSAHFDNPHSLIVDSNENIYVADSANNVVRMISGSTGDVSAFAGGSGAGCVSGTKASCTATFAGDGAPATSASLSDPYEVALDVNNNVYIADAGNKRIRVVYKTGTIPALTAAGISNPVAGDIYTIAGGNSAGVVGTSTTSGTAATSLDFSSPRGVTLDALGNIYVSDFSTTGKVWRIDGQSGIGTIFAGGGSATTAGAHCSGSTGPTATDTVGDGCPATLAYVDEPVGRLVFDVNDVGYIIDYVHGRVRSLTFNERFPDTAVSSSSTFSIAVTSPNSFSAPILAVTAGGSTTGEISSSNVNCTSGTITANTVCTYNIQFTPVLPGARVGNIQVTSTTSGAGTLSYGLDGKGLGPLLALAPSISSAFASSTITTPANVAVDQIGDIYVSDTSHDTLWKGTVGGAFTAALTGLSSPGQAATDGAGNVYVANTGNNSIVELSASGVMSTLAISGLSSPTGIASTGNGVLYIADTGNNRILRYDETKVVTLALTGLSGPTALALDGSGLLYIVDAGNSRIVTINSDGTQNTVPVGTTITPIGLAVDAGDDIYIADKSSGSVLALFSGTSTPVTKVSGLSSPAGVALDGSGNLYYTDAAVAGVYELAQQNSALTFADTNEGEVSAAQTLTLSNIGNQSLSFTSANIYAGSGNTADFTIGQSTPACGPGLLAAAGFCAFSTQFTPVSVGAYQESISFPSNAVDAGSASAQLTGTGVNLIKTSIDAVLTSPASGGVSYGQNAVYTATITPSSTTTDLSGNIVVSVDGTTSQTLTVTGASAQFTLVFTAGTHVVSVTYSGNTTYASSYDTFILTVSTQATTTSLSSSTNLQSGTASLTLQAQIASTISGVPTGTVTFYNGSTVIGTGTLNAQGTANYTTTTTTYPSYGFQAVYSGNTNYAGSSSATITLKPDFSVIQASSVIGAANGIPTDTTVTLIPYFGYTGTLTYSCTGLPVDAACRFQPQSVILSSGTSQTLTLEFFTGLSSSSVALLHRHDSRELASLACLFAPMLLLGGWRRPFRGVHGKVRLTVLPLVCLIGIGSLAGCSKSTSYPTGSTPTGTSTVVLTVTDAAGLSRAVTYNVTVY
jgi:sugar lactone lactonase YvrE